mmetsp:Transcript_29126/g.42974  ORF Transcript_29126/g.42974 Transcript_29126/m.42974 type:complete len:485 (-) Transcript_29126:235-1689(-)
MQLGWLILLSVLFCSRAFQPPSSFVGCKVAQSCENPTTLQMNSNAVPDLKATSPRDILLMIEPTPFTHVSGYSNRFKEMLRFLDKAGDNVDILTTDSKTPKKELPKNFLRFAIEYTLGFVFPLYNQITLTIDLPEMKGAKMIGNKRPQLIHVTSPGFMVYPAMLYAKYFKIPLVMSYHTHLPVYGRNYLGFIPRIEDFAWFLLRRCHACADLTLVTSAPIQKELIDNGIQRVEVWRKGIDTERFDPKFRSDEMRKEMSDDNPDDFLMVYVGRLGAEKRLKDIKPMLEKMPNARVCFVGKGPAEQELKEHFKGTKTVFTGQLSGDKLSSAFASADAFIMPSDSETLGFVVLESMASGVPVVAANAGGIPDIIDDGETSFLVDPDDTDAYVERLTQLTNPSFRKEMGIKAREEAERWGWEAATSVLRNEQYETALRNWRSREYKKFQNPWKLRRQKWKVRFGAVVKSPVRLVGKLFGKKPEVAVNA